MTNVLVTAIGGGGHGEQILKALRLAESGRYRVYGTDMRATVAHSKLVEEFALVPPAKSPEYVSQILRLCQKWRIKALFHGCEEEMVALSDARQAFAEQGVLLPMNNEKLIKLCLNKAHLNEKLRALGFHPPKGFAITSPDDVDLVDFYPVVVKPSVGGGGSANVYIAQDKNELRSLLTFLNHDTSLQPLLVQEYVGSPSSEFTIGVLHDLEGVFIDAIAVNRDLRSTLSVRARVPNRSAMQSLGPVLVVSSGVSQGQIGKFPALTTQARKLADALGSTGPLNIQCRVTEGELRVFEINPRYSGTTSIRAQVGFNEPDLMLRRYLFNEKIPRDCLWPSRIVTRQLVEVVAPKG